MGQSRFQPSRRQFLQVSFAAGVGLTVASLAGPMRPARAGDASSSPQAQPGALNAWVRVSPQNRVTVMIHHSEMGQGIITGLCLIVAEELEVPWSQVDFAMAPVAPVYRNPAFGVMGTGGSTSIRTSWQPLRLAAAGARELLRAAAAQAWQAPLEQCAARQGHIWHQDGRSLAYGQLLASAATQPAPENPPLKDPASFTLLGKGAPRLDLPDKVEGKAVFGVDVRLPGQLFATVVHPPTIGGGLKSLDPGPAAAMPGVRKILPVSSGVAVVAQHMGQALRAAGQLKVTWEPGPLAGLSSDVISRRFLAQLNQEGEVVGEKGDVAAALKQGAKLLEAVYELPYQAHLCPEPMNCTAWVTDKGCQVWVPTQGQDAAREEAARVSGHAPEKVKVYTTYLGGGFGRRYLPDQVTEAVELSAKLGAPVQVMWSREDDVRGDYFRPAFVNLVRAALDQDGLPLAWLHRAVGPGEGDGIVNYSAPAMIPTWLPGPVRRKVAQGAAWLVNRSRRNESAMSGATPLPYAIPHQRVEFIWDDPGVPVGAWRSVGDSRNAFVVECFLDEIAAAGGRDPVELRRKLLASSPRHLGVLDLAAQKAGWGSPLPAGKGRGVAVHAFHGTPAAMVAEVEVSPGGPVRVRRVVCAVDCGRALNPSQVQAQMVSGIVFGLSATLKSSVTLDKGQVQQSNFSDFPILAMDEMPQVEVHLAPSQEPPIGVGEVGVPPIAPAVANAIFAASGRRVRKLPVLPADLR